MHRQLNQTAHDSLTKIYKSAIKLYSNIANMSCMKRKKIKQNPPI